MVYSQIASLHPITHQAVSSSKEQENMSQNTGESIGQDPIASEKISVERKIFFLDLKENNRGRFLKITEDVGGRRDTIMLPSEAFQDFTDALLRLVEFEKNHQA
jgi:hypothetical protein